MWQLGGYILKSPATDIVNCFVALQQSEVALQLHEYMMLKLFPLLCLALHVSDTNSHCIR